jgi:cysteinyl-tRNA synthetase
VWDGASVAASSDVPSVPAEIAALVAARDEARAARDYSRADELRREIAELGWDVVDGPDGSTVRPH